MRHLRPGRIQLSVLVFAALWGVAMALYPGWSWLDEHQVGHRFWHNFLCDVIAAETLGGTDNRAGSTAVTLGVFVLLFGALVPLWWRVDGPTRRVTRLCATATCALMVLVAAELTFTLPWHHATLTLVGGVFGLVATALLLRWGWRRPETTPLQRGLAVVFLGAAAVNFGTYAAVQLGWMPMHVVLPASQKVVVLGLLPWIYLQSGGDVGGPLRT